MKISQQGIDFIKDREGFKDTAYQDQAGIWTIGYGTIQYLDKRPVRVNDKITKELAEVLLLKHIETKIEPRLNSILNDIPISQNQYDALCDFCYNLGTAAFAGSPLYARIMRPSHNNASIADAFKMWNKVRQGGKLIVSNRMVKRRQLEIDLYFKNIYA